MTETPKSAEDAVLSDGYKALLESAAQFREKLQSALDAERDKFATKLQHGHARLALELGKERAEVRRLREAAVLAEQFVESFMDPEDESHQDLLEKLHKALAQSTDGAPDEQ